MATPLGPEKYGIIDFSLGRWITMGQNAPKLELKHAKEQVELVNASHQSLKGKFIELGQKIQQL